MKDGGADGSGNLTPVRIILAAASCFAIGFGLHMNYPALKAKMFAPGQEVAVLPVPEPVAAAIVPVKVAPPPVVPRAPQGFAVVEVKPRGSFSTADRPGEKHDETLAGLTRCKIAFAAGESFGGASPNDLATMLDIKTADLSARQIAAGCKLLLSGADKTRSAGR